MLKGKIFVFNLVLLFSLSARTDWAKNFGAWMGSTADVHSQATDASGNLYVAGSFEVLALQVGGVTLNRIGFSDAFVIKMDSSGTVLWAKNFGGTSSVTASANSVAVDGSGNVYLGGNFTGNNLTTPALTKKGFEDAFVIKLDSSGNTTWAKNYGGTPSVTAATNSIAVDGSGNVYLGGYFTGGNLTTPAITKIGTQDAFVIKLDSSGNTTWAQNYGGSSLVTMTGRGLAVEGSSNVYLSGDFGTNNLTTPALTKIGSQDAFVFKLDSSGSVTWAKNFGGSGSTVRGKNVVVDGSGNVYLGGDFFSASLTTPALSVIGLTDTFAVKLDSSGNTVWSKNFGGNGVNAYIYGIAVDASGNVFLGGNFSAGDLTTPALTKIGTYDAFVFRLDSSGNTSWSQGYGGLNPTGGISVVQMVKDKNGSIYVTGTTAGSRSYIGGVTLVGIGIKDAFVAKMDAFGTVLWAKNFGGVGSTTVTSKGIAVDASGNVYVGGWFDGSDLSTPVISMIGTSSNGDTDAFLLKLDSSGNTVWAKNFGGSGVSAHGEGVAVDASGNVYLGGNFSGNNLTTPALTRIGAGDAFVFKLDSSGSITWKKNFGGSGASVQGENIAVDASSNVYLGGSFFDSNLTTPALTMIGDSLNGDKDIYALKLDSSGNTTWAKNFGGTGATVLNNGIAVDASGSVYLGGSLLLGNMTTPALALIGTQDAYAIKLNSSGSVTWAKNFGGSSVTTSGDGLAVDASGNVYLGGDFSGGDLTTPALTKIGVTDGYLVQLDSSGSTTWSKNFGGSGVTVSGKSVAFDGYGNVYLVGSFSGSNLTTPAATLNGGIDGVVIDVQLFGTSCTQSGKWKWDSANNVMVFCDGTRWQSINNSASSACTGTVTGKLQYYSNGASSDFVWYADSCRSTKSTTTFGACTVNGEFEWDNSNSTLRGCINGTWTSLKGW